MLLLTSHTCSYRNSSTAQSLYIYIMSFEVQRQPFKVLIIANRRFYDGTREYDALCRDRFWPSKYNEITNEVLNFLLTTWLRLVRPVFSFSRVSYIAKCFLINFSPSYGRFRLMAKQVRVASSRSSGLVLNGRNSAKNKL